MKKATYAFALAIVIGAVVIAQQTPPAGAGGYPHDYFNRR